MKMIVPSEIQRRYSGLQIRGDAWPHVAEGVFMQATTGWSTVFEHRLAMAMDAGIDPNSGSLKRLFSDVLPRSGLAIIQTLPLIGRSSLTLTRLTPLGEQLARDLGCEPIESDWIRMIRLHAGDRQPRHMVATLYFCHQARLRGYQATVVPEVGDRWFAPDVLVERTGQRIYVEVELGHGKIQKWRNQYHFQRAVVFCALTPKSRRGLKFEALRWNLRGVATDLSSLIKRSKSDPVGPLWIDRWDI